MLHGVRVRVPALAWYQAVAAPVSTIGKASDLPYAPIGAALSGVGKALVLVFTPIGAVSGLIAGAKR